MAFWHMMVFKNRALAVGLMLFVTGPVMAQKAASSSSSDWTLDPGKGFVSRSLRMGTLFEMRLNGRSLVSTPGTKKEKDETPEPEKKPGEEVTVINAKLDDKPIALERKMLLDRKRNAVLIVDLFTNKENSEQSMQLYYFTALSAGRKVTFNGGIDNSGASVERGAALSPESIGGIVLAESEDTPALPMFVWGQQDAVWSPVVPEFGNSRFTVRYEGTLPAGGKVAFVHWVAVAGLDPKIKVEKGFDSFWKDGHLVDTELPPGVLPEMVGNFKASAFEKAKPEEKGKGPGALAALDEKCARLDLKRGAKDILWMGKNEQLAGIFSADNLSLEREGGNLSLPLDTVAAIQGGAGKGRLHRVWLRDGSVLSGRVTLPKGELQSDAGIVAVNADSLEFLLLKGLPEDGTPPAAAMGLLQTGDGEHLWLGAAPFTATDLISTFGKLSIPSTEVVGIKRSVEPPFAQQVILKDGSSLLGVFSGPAWQCRMVSGSTFTLPSSRVLRWTIRDAWGKEADPDAPPAASSHALLRDGTRLAGLPAESTFQIKTGSGEVTVKLEEVSTLKFESSTSVSAVLQSGAKVQGVPLTSHLTWKIAGQSVQVPGALLSDLSISTKPAPTPES